MKRISKIIALILLIGFLVLIRGYENKLFYDPLIQFFKTDHTTESLPAFNTFNLLGNISLRFLANSLVSLAILWLVFKDRGIIKLSILIFLFFYIVMMVAFCFLLYYSEATDYVPLFYVRRFLIQPVLILLLLPAFYFHKRK